MIKENIIDEILLKDFPVKFTSETFPFLENFYKTQKQKKAAKKNDKKSTIFLNFQNNDFDFKYSEHDLQILLSGILQKIINSHENEVSSIYILYSSISWMNTFNILNDGIDKLNLILKSLLYIPDPKYKQIAIKMFCLIFNEVTEKSPDIMFEPIEKTISFFISSTDLTDSQSLNLSKWVMNLMMNCPEPLMNKKIGSTSSSPSLTSDSLHIRKQIVSSPSTDNNDLSVQNLNHPFSSEASIPSNIASILTFIIQKIKEVPTFFNENDALTILNSIKPYLRVLDIFMLNILINLVPILDQTSINTECLSLLTSLVSLIKSSPLIINYEENNNLIENNIHINLENFSSKEILNSNKIFNLIPNEIKVRIQQIAQISKKTTDNIFSYFPNFLGDASSTIIDPYYFSILACLLYLCNLLKNFIDSSTFFFFLVSHFPLSSTKSIFSSFHEDPNNFDENKLVSINLQVKRSLIIIASFKFSILEIILRNNNEQCLLAIWKQINSKYDLASEFLYYLLITNENSMPEEIGVILYDSYNLLSSLKSKSLLHMLIMKISQIKIINNKKITRHLLSCDPYVTFLVKSIFNKDFQKQYFTIIQENFDLCFVLLFPKIIEYLDGFSNNDKTNQNIIYVISKFLGISTEYLNNNTSLFLNSPGYSQKIETLISFLEFSYEILSQINERNETNLVYLHNFLRYLSQLSTYNTNISTNDSISPNSVIKTSFIESISSNLIKSIKIIEGNEPSSELFMIFMELISKNSLSSLKPEFHIKQPIFLSIFIMSFVSSSRICGYLTFLQELCKFSMLNCHACHSGKLDRILIDIAKERYREVDLLKASLNLFTTIATIASSIEVVQHFITQFFIPIRRKYLSPLMFYGLKAMENLASINYDYPTAFLPLTNNGPFIEINNFNVLTSQISQGFTVAFWIYMDNGSLKSSANLFSVGCSNIKSFSNSVLVPSSSSSSITPITDESLSSASTLLFFNIMIHFSKIIIKIDENEIITIPETIPPSKWTFFAVTLDEADNNIKCFINNHTTKFQLKSKIDFSQTFYRKKLFASCGGENSEGYPSDYPTLLSSISLFPKLTSSEIFNMSQENIISHDHNEKEFFSIVVESHRSILSLKTISKYHIKVNLIGKEMSQPMPFTELFIKFFSIDALIPLFAQLNLQFQENTNDSLSTDIITYKIVDVLFIFLQNSQDLCNKFVNSDSISIVKYLLYKSQESITESLFLQIYAIAKIIKNSKLKNEIMNKIIFNEKLWIHSKTETIFQTIIKHWNDIISKNLTNIDQTNSPESLSFEFSRSFSEYLNDFFSLFWIYKTFEKETRKILILFLVQLAKRNFTKKDLTTLIAACIKFNDETKIRDMLSIIRKIGILDKSPFSKYPAITFFPLHQIVKWNNGENIYQLIKTIIDIHKFINFSDMNVVDHLNEITRLISNFDCFTEKRLKSILFKLQDNIVLFPLCCMLFSTDNFKQYEETFKSTIKQVINIPFETYSSWTLWAIWPLYLGLIKGKIFLSNIIQKIIESSMLTFNNLTEAFSHIYMISNTLNNINGEICREFLLQIGYEILINFSVDNVKNSNISTRKYKIELKPAEYVELCYFYIFYNGLNHCLLNDFRHSPFCASLAFPPDWLRINHPQNAKFSPPIINPCFKIDSNGNWMDNELALQCSQIILEKNCSKYYTFGFFLLSLLIKSLPQASQKLSPRYLERFNFDAIFLSFLKQKYPKEFKNLSCSPSTSNFDIFNLLSNQFQPIKDKINGVIKSFFATLPTVSFNYQKVLGMFHNYIINTSLKSEFHDGKKKWYNLWHRMTMDSGPWNSTSSDDLDEDYSSFNKKHWKRDARLCTTFLIPSRMKPNYRFDDHREASFCRDLGCIEAAREHNKDYQKSLKEIIENQTPKLLKVNTNKLYSNNSSEKANNMKIKKYNNQFKVKCLRITITKTKKCTLFVLKDGIHLYYKDQTSKIEYNSISRIFLREIMHYPNAIEIFTLDGESFLLQLKKVDNFTNIDLVNLIERFLPVSLSKRIQKSFALDFFEQSGLQKQWMERKISNFEYLMILNLFSGRSFNKASLYPIFPWIITDYSSSTLDISLESKSFRNLSKPIGSIGEKRFIEIQKRVRDMEQFGQTSFYYSSYAVTPLYVYLWLMRMEPFTTLHIQMQNGKFDHASRLFASVADTFRMVTSNMNDFRELLPEFYFQPEFLVNSNDFDLGNINDVKIDNVILPQWAHENPFQFVYSMRKALESEYVSMHLNEWIDLIWGYKQRGKDAVKAENTYDPNIYSDIWNDPELQNDEEKRNLIEATLEHCGQIPSQLFKEPHPQRSPHIESSIYISAKLQNEPQHKRRFSMPIGFLNNKASGKESANKQQETSPGNSPLLKRQRSRQINMLNSRKLSMNISQSINNDKILFCTITTMEDFVFRFLIITKFGNIFSVSVDFVQDLILESKLYPITIDSNSATSFSMINTNTIAIGSITGSIVIINGKSEAQIKKYKAQIHSGRVNCLASLKQRYYIISGGVDTTINCYDVSSVLTQNSQINNDSQASLKCIFSIPSFHSEIECTAPSNDFHIIVSGTHDGYLIINDSKSGNIINTISLQDNRKPIKIIVTPSWGLIVVCTSKNTETDPIYELSVYSINGLLLNRCTVYSQVEKWITWPNRDGFDCIIAALGNGILIGFEAYYLNIKIIQKNDFKVVAMNYCIDDRYLLVVDKESNIFIINNVFIDTNRILYVNKV